MVILAGIRTTKIGQTRTGKIISDLNLDFYCNLFDIAYESEITLPYSDLIETLLMGGEL